MVILTKQQFPAVLDITIGFVGLGFYAVPTQLCMLLLQGDLSHAKLNLA